MPDRIANLFLLLTYRHIITPPTERWVAQNLCKNIFTHLDPRCHMVLTVPWIRKWKFLTANTYRIHLYFISYQRYVAVRQLYIFKDVPELSCHFGNTWMILPDSRVTQQLNNRLNQNTVLYVQVGNWTLGWNPMCWQK